ncbi:MAG: GNAT family N-acetyltransferase [Clostridia bacterium]
MFTLRDIEFEDYKDLYPCGIDEEAKKFFDPNAFKSLAHLKEYFTDFFIPLKEETIIPPQIIVKDNKIIGLIYFCHLKEKESVRESELGFVLHKEYRGKGIVTNASKIMLKRAFDELDVDFMKISCLPSNKASKTIAKKLGMSFDQYWYSDGTKICLFKISKDQYYKSINSCYKLNI